MWRERQKREWGTMCVCPAHAEPYTGLPADDEKQAHRLAELGKGIIVVATRELPDCEWALAE